MKKIVFIIVIFAVTVVQAQQNLKLADRYFDNTDYSAAIPYYEAAATERQSAQLVKNLADSYYFINDFQKAQRWYSVLSQNFKADMADEHYFRYIHTLKAVGKNDQAHQLMRDNAKDTQSLAEIELAINKLEKISKAGERYTIKHLPLNSEFSEFGAVEFNDSIVFTGSSKKSQGSEKIYKWNNENYLNLQVIALNNIAEVGLEAKSFAPELDTDMHEGSAVFTKDGSQMYFTRNNYRGGKRSDDKDNTSHLQIYRAERVNGKWNNVTSLPFNSENYSTEHPALSTDEKTLYFASDMPGSLGSFDIYSVAINDGRFEVPKNLGSVINTVHKEQFPFESSDNKLYFSSDGHFGYGALDVFVSEIKNGEFQTPINVGLPINSGYDDFSFTINATTKKGYFASNRTTGQGSDDIYELLEKMPVPKEDPLDIEEAAIADGDKQSRIDAIMAKEPDVVEVSGRLIIKTAPIYFDFDLWYIRKESKPILNRVIELMKQYPQMAIEIGSHTDNRGNDAYNEELSSKRAASTRDYFLENGIPASRITSKGYGESMPITKCIPESNCSEEQHELNRRSEFVVTGI